MLRKLTTLLGCSLGLCLCTTHPLLAQPTSSPASQGGSGDPTPSTASGGRRQVGERQTCASIPEDAPESALVLTSLIVENQSISPQQTQGNLYVYIPPETNKVAVLEVTELSTQTSILEAELELQTADAIARFVLPDTVQLSAPAGSKLQYEWVLSVYCDPQSDVAIEVKGTISPVELDSGLELGESREPINAATSLQFWYEYLATWSSQQANTAVIWPDPLTSEVLNSLTPYGNQTVETYVLTDLSRPSTVGDL